MMVQVHGLGREKYLRGHIALWVMLIAGVILLFYSVYIGVMIGSDWFGANASFQWHMNNYIVMEARYAYSIFGLATLAIGGLATGLAMSAFFTFTKSKKHVLVLVAAFFVAIVMTGLGFNTLDFMLGSFYWTNMQYPPPVHVALFGPVDVWNFYFFFFVAPLWAGGFIMGLAASYYAFSYRLKHSAAAYLVKKNFAGLLNQTSQAKEYIAESTGFSRNRKMIKQSFENTN
jgi:hypothetical protein